MQRVEFGALKRRAVNSRALHAGLRIGGRRTTPSAVLLDACERGVLTRDDAQLRAAAHLDRLATELDAYEPPPLPPAPASSAPRTWRGPQFDAYGQPVAGGSMYTGVEGDGSGGGGSPSLLSRLGALLGSSSSGSAATSYDEDLHSVIAPRGVYMVGGVGCGKTFLMDIFYECCRLPEPAKRRMHFHEFMLEVHSRMHALRRDAPDLGDPLPVLAHDLASSTRLLCFDEFQVTDVADALVMRRLFRRLFSLGLVMVATSNRVPEDLYLNGIQRQLFLPFIDDLRLRCECVEYASSIDYRMLGTVSSGARTYLWPLSAETHRALDTFFEQLSAGDRVVPQTLQLRGRELCVERASAKGLVARFSFDELCGRPLGAEDYLSIAKSFRTVFLENVPQLTLAEVNQVRRLITLVDAFYDKQRHGDLLGSSAYVPDASDESFAFGRTLSRLKEMSSHAYLTRSVSAHMAEADEDARLLVRFESGSRLKKSELRTLFRRFDVDGSGALEPPEVRLLLEEVSERRRGHRNVLDEEVHEALRRMDGDENGEVSEHEFIEHFGESSLANVKVLQFGGGRGAAMEGSRALRSSHVSRSSRLEGY